VKTYSARLPNAAACALFHFRSKSRSQSPLQRVRSLGLALADEELARIHVDVPPSKSDRFGQSETCVEHDRDHQTVWLAVGYRGFGCARRAACSSAVSTSGSPQPRCDPLLRMSALLPEPEQRGKSKERFRLTMRESWSIPHCGPILIFQVSRHSVSILGEISTNREYSGAPRLPFGPN